MADDDWRPKLAKIEEPMAEDFWRYTTPQGKRRTSKIAVGRPVHFPQERCWYSPVMIEGYLPRVTPVFGEGPVDSLMNAMTLIKKFHDEVREIVPGARKQKAAKGIVPPKARGKTASSKVQRNRSRSSPRQPQQDRRRRKGD